VSVVNRIGLSTAWQRRLVWFMEVSLVGMLFIGIERGSAAIVVNTGVGLLVMQLPPLLDRDYDITMDVGLTLWISAAVWLHALGVVGLPMLGLSNFYRDIWWWDHMTHALSSSVVAAVGYTTVRALDSHSEDVYVPPKFAFVFILLFVLAFGVLWEVIEFAIMETSTHFGTGTVLTQYGLDDTLLDLVFDSIGAIIVAIWGTAHLTGVVDGVSEWLEDRS